MSLKFKRIYKDTLNATTKLYISTKDQDSACNFNNVQRNDQININLETFKDRQRGGDGGVQVGRVYCSPGRIMCSNGNLKIRKESNKARGAECSSIRVFYGLRVVKIYYYYYSE